MIRYISICPDIDKEYTESVLQKVLKIRNIRFTGMGHLLSIEEISALLPLCPVVHSVFLLTLSRKEELIYESAKNWWISERTSS